MMDALPTNLFERDFRPCVQSYTNNFIYMRTLYIMHTIFILKIYSKFHIYILGKFCTDTSVQCNIITTRLKNNIESNSTWEGASYQSEWVKINSNWVFSFFHFTCAAANASELFCMAHLANNGCFLYHPNLSHSSYLILKIVLNFIYM